MTDKYSNNEIYQMLKGLTKTVKDGFDGVHKRQDKTNGNIKENREEIDKLKIWRGVVVGGLAVITAVVIPLAFIWLRSVL